MYQRSSGQHHAHQVAALGRAQSTGGFYSQLRTSERVIDPASFYDDAAWHCQMGALDAPSEVPSGSMKAGSFHRSSVVDRWVSA